MFAIVGVQGARFIYVTSKAGCAILLLALLRLEPGCGHKAPPPPVVEEPVDAAPPPEPVDAAPPPLFERLGGKDAIGEIVKNLVAILVKDPELGRSFDKFKRDKERQKHFREALAEYLCALTGGPCTYSGKDMKTAHKGLGITETQWNGFVSDFQTALQTSNVADEVAKELTERLDESKGDIVEKPGK